MRAPAGGLIDAQTAALAAQRLAGELYRQTGPAKVAAAAEHIHALLDAGGTHPPARPPGTAAQGAWHTPNGAATIAAGQLAALAADA